jgi:hypothetical protein
VWLACLFHDRNVLDAYVVQLFTRQAAASGAGQVVVIGQPEPPPSRRATLADVLSACTCLAWVGRVNTSADRPPRH